MEELKPCPFCGSPAELTHTKTWDYYVRCTNKACAARTRQYHENDVGAVSAWNARAERTWTPTSEKLPDDEELKLVSCRSKKGVRSVNRAYYHNGFWHGSGSMSGVEAWMPMPEPYDHEGEVDDD